ncbi:MAG: GerMN domain-containing protein [Acidimicrobiia bacterium]|nr:GerMN domain-containing protein [Acidimicrobiia bacterium]
MKRPAVVLVMLALAAAACAEPVVDAGPITTRPAGSGGTVATTTTTAAPTTTSATTSTSGASPTTAATTTGAATTTTAAPGTMGLKVYFMLEGGGSDYRPGPFLVPVYREVPRTQAVARAAVNALIAGPTAEEKASVPALSSAVPADTILLGINIADGLATVDLSREFEAAGGTFAMAARLAQVVFTLTQFPTVAEVQFHLDGEPVTVFSSEGIIMDHPVDRADYEDLTPAIFIDDPAYGAPVGGDIRVEGVAAVFEAQFNWVLANWDGLVVAEGFAMTDNGAGWGSFVFTIDVPYEVDAAQSASLIVFDYSAQDGTQENVREHPIRLQP